MTKRIFKVLPEQQWQQAVQAEVFSGCGIDLTDGFIHLSSEDQVIETVSKHFSGQSGLVIVEIDPESLGDSLRWEVSRGGEPFPHVYGDIPVSAAIRVEPLPLGNDGQHIFPKIMGITP